MADLKSITRRQAFKALPTIASAATIPSFLSLIPMMEPPSSTDTNFPAACTLTEKIKTIRRIEANISPKIAFEDSSEYPLWEEHFSSLSDPQICVVKSTEDAVAALRFIHAEMLNCGEGDYFPVMLSALIKWIDPTQRLIA